MGRLRDLPVCRIPSPARVTEAAILLFSHPKNVRQRDPGPRWQERSVTENTPVKSRMLLCSCPRASTVGVQGGTQYVNESLAF